MLFYILWLFSPVHPATIVFNAMHASSSHTASMLPIATRMAADGHSVHFLESNTKDKAFNYPDNITYTYCKLPENPLLHQVILPAMWTHTYKPWNFPQVWTSGDDALVNMYNMHNEKFMNVFNKNWDLAMGDELFAVASYALALRTKEKGNPFLMTATCVQNNPMRYHLSLGGNSLHRPSMFQEDEAIFDVSSFYSRLMTIAHDAVIFPGIWYYTTYEAVKGLKLVNLKDFSYDQLASKVSYYFIDELNPLTWPTSIGNEVLHIGFHCPEYKNLNLSEDYIQFLEDPTSKGTILIAFGTNVLWGTAPDQITTSFVKAINRLRSYRFVFAFNGKKEQLEGLGDHCKVTSWAPQKEILNHNKTKLFISHGGLKSCKDTLCGTVPAIILPLFAEQTHNAEMIRQLGFGKVISKYKITESILYDAIIEMTENDVYKKNVVRRKSLFLDQPVSSLDLVSFATRRALNYKNSYPTYKRKGIFLTMREHFFFDATVILLILLILISH